MTVSHQDGTVSADPRPVRVRRSSDEIRRRLLGASQEVFSERGYANASIRTIAERAGVAEVLIYRHFQSKVNLFRSAVLAPLEGYLRNIDQRCEDRLYDDATPDEYLSDFIGGLYDVLRAERRLIIALHAAQNQEEELRSKSPLSEHFAISIRQAEEFYERRGWPVGDVSLQVRLSFGTVLAAATYDDWLMPDEDRPGRDVVVRELMRFVDDARVGRMAQMDTRRT
jgi:AcrR family transcriptional regulator